MEHTLTEDASAPDANVPDLYRSEATVSQPPPLPKKDEPASTPKQNEPAVGIEHKCE
jgi:hypothetical protein